MKFWSKIILLAAFIVAAFVPATRMSADGGFRVQGGQIYDAGNNPVQLRGVNWFGFETNNKVVHGLWARNWKDMIAQMRTANFNAVRLPFCPATLRGAAPTSIDYSKNPDLQNKNSLEILDSVVSEFDRQGMYVLLDHHTPDCSSISELWYTGGYSEQQWIADLVFVANRYKNLPHFVGIDLKNEPHGQATWGTGNNATDWNKAAERAASQILANAPNILIFVEGIQENPVCSSNQYGHFWGGNLEPLACTPLDISADRLVLSPHAYGPDVYDQPYFQTGDFPNNMPAIWTQHFGQFAGSYTIVPGEFGGKYGQGNPRDRAWQNAFVDYLISKNIRSAFYWSWNPNSGDTGGILQDDWQTIRQDKVDLLNRLWGNGSNPTPSPSPSVAPSPSPTATPTPTPTATPTATPTPGGGVSFVQTTSSDWGAGYCSDVRVTNNGGAPVDWTVRVSAAGSINNFWNGVYSRANQNEISVSGVSWNAQLQPGASANFGFCAERAAAPTPTATPTPSATPTPTATPTATPPNGGLTTTVTRTSDWNTGYCADVVVRNNGASPVDWTTTFQIQGRVNNLWNANYTQNGSQVTADGVSWNNIVQPNGTVTFGFCADK